MQLWLRVARPILFSIICLIFLSTTVCGSGLTSAPPILQNISSIPIPDSATFSPQVQTLNLSSERPVYSASSPDLTSSPIIKSNNTLKIKNRQRLATLNPDFIAYQQNVTTNTIGFDRTSLQVSENRQHGLGFIPSATNLSYTKGLDVSRNIASIPASKNVLLTVGGTYPPRFDLRTMTKVTPVRDQGSAGICWVQATYASLESYLLPGESWDFSENNMKNLLSSAYPEGFDRTADGGGNAFMSTAYLARWSGPINESDDPYDPISKDSPTDKPVKKHVQNVLFLPDRANSTDNNNIKSALMTYGSVYTSMYYNGLYSNNTNAAYYFNGSANPNHAVGIVGWDDHYSKYNFTTDFTPVPPGDGAFIVKNSWGTGFGQQGYFYISYYDKYVGLSNAIFEAESGQNYDRIYQYDPLGWVNNFGGMSNSEWGANIFTSNSTETLSAVSFYATDINTVYDLYVYKNPNNGPINSAGYSYRETGTIEGPPGYYTKVISPGVSLLPGEKFSVVINMTTQNTLYPLPVENSVQSYSSHATAHSGESYYSDDGGQTWSDMASYDPTENICIKAFTILPRPKSAFSADILSGNSPLTVTFTDTSEGSPTTWNWSFGDGSFNTSRNPSHSFTHGGAFTVTLDVTNAAGTGTTTKTNYIIVDGDKIGVFRTVSGNWYLDYNNTGVADKMFHFGTSGDIPVIGDWNGDGTSDAGVYRPSSGNWHLNYYKDSISHKAFHFGTSGDIPVVGDWNGDGTSDAGVYRPSSGNWYLDYNNTGVVDKTFHFGTSGDIPVIGDWNGDGTSDAGVYRPSNGNWYLDYTKTGVVDKTFHFGTSGDIPVIGDWNGDGTSDAGVYRPSNGNWYLDYTKTGVVDKTFHFGTAGDSPKIGKWK